ncbi:MAG: 4Fe-4S binding protein [Desulfobacterales bacterium]|nr:4Fe-4S binding protein [Desulfobacterales bacterium]
MKQPGPFRPARREASPQTSSAEKAEAGLPGRRASTSAIAEGDFAALKIHFGEAGNTGYIKPPVAGRAHLGGPHRGPSHAFLTDSNTLYVGNRSNSIDHLRLAWSHGFTPEIDGPARHHRRRPHRPRQARSRRAPQARTASSQDRQRHPRRRRPHRPDPRHRARPDGPRARPSRTLGMGCASRAGKLDQHSVTHPRVNAKQCRNCSVCMAFCPEAAIVQAEGHVVIDPAKCIGCGECLVVCKFGAIKMKWDEDSLRLQEKMAEYALRVVGHLPGQGRLRSTS